MATDAVKQLEAAGIDVSKMTTEERQALNTLTTEEVTTLITIRQKLTSDTTGFARSRGLTDDTGYIIY